MDQVDVFRKALENPLAVSSAEFQELLTRYPYCQPLIFAQERKKSLEQEPLDNQKTLIYAYSPFWLRDYLSKPVEVIPELEVDSDDYVAYEELEIQELERAPSADTTALESEQENPQDVLSSETAFESTEEETTNIHAATSTHQDAIAEESEEEELSFDPPLTYNIEKEFAEQERTQETVSHEATNEEKVSQDDISLYNDELMPYSFRWWLYKTRLEHADTYQPFAAPELPRPQAGQFDPKKLDEAILDQQIRENIFHLQDPEDKLSKQGKKQTIEFGTSQRMGEVIDKFIREEPQIQPPKAEEINTENKARRSSEDQSRVVTETLADIYVAQGMYERALSVFKKLISENPEKKSYFATRIRAVEKKL
ncbi:MAG: hypothetical protein ACTHZ7_13470 [Sphingobacterium sp.]